MFISVDLPAPFSPSSAWTSPTAQVEVDVVVGDHAREPLDDASHLDRERGRRSWPKEASEPRRPPQGGAPEVPACGLIATAGRPRCRPPTSTCRSGSWCRLRWGTGRGRPGSSDLALRKDLVALVVHDRTGEDVEAVELARQHRCQRVLDQLHVLLGQVGDAGLRRLALHEAEEAHGACVGVEVLVAGGVLAGRDLLGDAQVLRAPDPVRRRQAGVAWCRSRGGRR